MWAQPLGQEESHYSTLQEAGALAAALLSNVYLRQRLHVMTRMEQKLLAIADDCCNGCKHVARQKDTGYLFKNGLQGSAALSAPGVGHNAEGAHVVAAPHDRQVCADAASWPDRQYVCIGFFCAELHIHGALMLAPACACTALQHGCIGLQIGLLTSTGGCLCQSGDRLGCTCVSLQASFITMQLITSIVSSNLGMSRYASGPATKSTSLSESSSFTLSRSAMQPRTPTTGGLHS